MLNHIESECFKNILKKDYKILAETQTSHVLKVYNKYKNMIDLELIEKDPFGLNFAFTGTTGIYYFPAALWYLQSYKMSKDELIKLKKIRISNINNLQTKIFNIIVDQYSPRKGYSIEFIECLNFYANYFNEYEYNLENLQDTSILEYNPIFFPNFTVEVLKNNMSNIKQTLGTYIIPNNIFWNLGSIVLDPFLDYNNFDLEYQIFPYWLIELGNNNYFRMYRISPEEFGNKFKFKYQIVNNLKFFINFRYYSQSKSELFSYSIPDLFKSYEIFEEQEFILLDKADSSLIGLKRPNWNLSIESPKGIQNQISLLDYHENEDINHFIANNLEIIIHLFNSKDYSEKLDIEKIMYNFERKNVFNKLFNKRLRIDRNNFNINLIIFLKFDKNRLKKYKKNLTDFFSSIFPTGIILDYSSGMMIFLSIYHEKKVKFIDDLNNFLHFFNIEYKIYSLPPTIFFNARRWEFPQFNINLSEKEFKQILPIILEKEKRFENNVKNIHKIEEFKKFINKLGI